MEGLVSIVDLRTTLGEIIQSKIFMFKYSLVMPHIMSVCDFDASTDRDQTFHLKVGDD
jgi:hypothetical protein